jgi:sulfur carrier protein
VIELNGRRCELGRATTVTTALEQLGLTPQARGIAVAVDGEVVPRAQWETFALPDGARVEVVTAMQGG